ncbi:MAG: response regulator [Proteobacteria bacterium]|nr:response regulator [Pseudomonadota bacterium]
MTKTIAPSPLERPMPPDAARIERAMTDGLMAGNWLRILALAMWGIFALAYGSRVPWWMIAGPAALHFGSMLGFLRLAQLYHRDPTTHSIEGWRRRYIFLAALTGLSYGIGALLLVPQPPVEPRMLVAATMASIAALPPGRTFEPRSYVLLACCDLLLLATGFLLSGDALAAPVSIGAVLYLVALLLQNSVQHRMQRKQTALALEHEDLAALHARREKEAEQARAVLQAVFDNMTDGVLLYEGDGRRVYYNPAILKLYDLSDETMADAPTFARLVRYRAQRGDYGPPDRLPGGLEAWVAQRAEDFQHHAFSTERQRTAAGRTVETGYQTLSDGRVLTIHHDLTEIVEREEKLDLARAESERAREEAEAANNAKSTFLATMSHEMRTPMNGVVGTAEVLQREPLNERQKRLVGTVRSSATALLRIIDDVLDFSKIEAGRMELEETPCSLRSLIAGTVETLSVQAEKKGLKLTASIDPETPDALLADVTRVRQILFNLIGNAIKFTDVGRIDVRVHATRIGDDGVTLALAITDTGIGLDPVQQARLFKPFSQADSSTTRRYGGTGLGLSIVRRLAELMGGSVAVESIPGRGSTFTVTMTVRRAAVAAVVEEKASELFALANAAPGLRVLAVDDNQVNLEVLTGQLELLGIPLDTAGNGIEALTRWRNRTYTLVLTDIHMPDMDGLELTRQIRAEETATSGRSRTPIVALTANALKGEAERCLAAGMDDYLTKPLTLDRLHDAMARWATMPEPKPAPSLDRSVVSQMFRGNPTTVERVLGRFRETGGKLVDEIAGSANEPDRLVELAHKLKGAARAAGAARLGDLAEALEMSAEARQVADLQREWDKVMTDLSVP